MKRPLLTLSQKVVDIGTGTGLWAMYALTSSLIVSLLTRTLLLAVTLPTRIPTAR